MGSLFCCNIAVIEKYDYTLSQSDIYQGGDMDFDQWKNTDWTEENYAIFREQALDALTDFLNEIDMILVKVLPTKFYLNGVISNKENRKWIQLKTPDVHDIENWGKGVSLRRMSSERDWRGENAYFCSWDDLQECLQKYMGDEYDDDIFDSARRY